MTHNLNEGGSYALLEKGARRYYPESRHRAAWRHPVSWALGVTLRGAAELALTCPSARYLLHPICRRQHTMLPQACLRYTYISTGATSTLQSRSKVDEEDVNLGRVGVLLVVAAQDLGRRCLAVIQATTSDELLPLAEAGPEIESWDINISCMSQRLRCTVETWLKYGGQTEPPRR
jgi:hypothetical protein